MKRSLVAAAVVVGGVALYARGCATGTPPDKKLGNHFEDVCAIAHDNATSPVEGVRALGRYLDKNGGAMHADWANTILMIERVADDDAHDARAREARTNIFGPLHACRTDLQRFVEAVNNDEEASAL